MYYLLIIFVYINILLLYDVTYSLHFRIIYIIKNALLTLHTKLTPPSKKKSVLEAMISFYGLVQFDIINTHAMKVLC